MTTLDVSGKSGPTAIVVYILLGGAQPDSHADRPQKRGAYNVDRLEPSKYDAATIETERQASQQGHVSLGCTILPCGPLKDPWAPTDFISIAPLPGASTAGEPSRLPFLASRRWSPCSYLCLNWR